MRSFSLSSFSACSPSQLKSNLSANDFHGEVFHDSFLLFDYFRITESRYEVSRIALIIVWALLRVIAAKPHLQAFLNIAQQKVTALRKENGTIKSDQLQKMIIRYAQYFCAAALQYYVPVFLTVVVALILKNLGDIDFMRAQTTTDEVEDSPSLASLKILLNFSAQKAFWSYCVVMLLIVNVTLTVFGTIYSYNFVSSWCYRY